MASLAFKVSTVAAGAFSDSLGSCQPALWGTFFAVLILFIRDKRQMARVGAWTIGLSFVGTAMSAYGAFSIAKDGTTPAMAQFLAGSILFFVGLIELYRHEVLKYEPLSHPAVAWTFRWLRRSTLPVLAFIVSVVEQPCSGGPYPLLAQALSVRPGQLIEMYLATYLLVLFIPFVAILLAWYAVLSIPGAEQFKARNRVLIRVIVGLASTAIGVYLLWNTHAITLLPGLANIGK